MAEEAAAATAAPAADAEVVLEPVARGLAKASVSLEVLYERYRERGEGGMVLKRFLKFFRDAVLFDNSWTWGQAVAVFFDHAEDKSVHSDSDGDERRLSFQQFRCCLRQFIRQSVRVVVMAQELQEAEEGGVADAEYFRWEAFKQLVGARLHGSPRSDGDEMLNKWVLAEHIQLLCLQNEYRLRRVYKTLVRQSQPAARSWNDLSKDGLLLKKEAMVKCLRNLIPQDQGVTLRGEDQSNALRYGNHENTSHEEGAKDSSQGNASFPEFIEMILRCCLGSTPFRSSTTESEEAADKENIEGNEEALAEDGKAEQKAEQDHDDARSFDIHADTMPFALQRIRKVFGWLWEWLDMELAKSSSKDNDHSLLMEDSPAYDEVYTDVQMLFAHYASGEPYSRVLDFTNPDLRLSGTDLLRQCRDTSLIDARLTLSVICDEFQTLTRHDVESGHCVSYFEWQGLMVRFASIKYSEMRVLDAIRVLLIKKLVPMVYVEIPTTDASDFVFTPRIVGLLLGYEAHVAKLLQLFATTKEIAVGPDGEQIAGYDETGTSNASAAAGRGSATAVHTETELKDVTKVTVKVTTLLDLVNFLKAVGFLPQVLAIEEVPEIFATVVNASPVQQRPIYEASICVSQVLVVLVHCALVGYARAPYSTKYATREEKVLATLERVEVAYLTLLRTYMPLKPRATFPSASRSLVGLTVESELRDFVITRRLERGMSLVPPAKSSRSAEALEDFMATHADSKAHRVFRAVPECEDGLRPASLGMPSLIREQLFAPPAPHPVGPLMETALMHHNAGRYRAAVETYLQALNTWAAIMAEESNSLSRANAHAGEGQEAEGKDEKESGAAGAEGAARPPEVTMDPELLLYFFMSLGGVYESAGLQELALACFCEAKIVGDSLSSSVPEQALGYAAIGSIFFHLEQYGVALSFYEKALDVREQTLGDLHMDTALLFNNIACCYDMLNRVTEAVESFQKAKDVFTYEYGLAHPRTSTALRNLSRIRHRRLDFAVKFEPRKPTPCPAVLVAAAGKKKKGKKGGKGKKKK